jgi:CRP-like cAMP-binding protein
MGSLTLFEKSDLHGGCKIDPDFLLGGTMPASKGHRTILRTGSSAVCSLASAEFYLLVFLGLTMLEKGDVVIWDSNEAVYEVGDQGFEAYLIMEGSVDILTSDGLRLSRLSKDEIFGETSLLLETTRTVSVVAGGAGVTARKIPKNYFDEIRRKDIVVAALIRKTQLRLIASNEQSNELSNELERISSALENALSGTERPEIGEDIKQRLILLRKKIDETHARID